MSAKSPEAFVSGALALVLHVSRFTGIAPLRFVKQRGGWRVSLSPWLSIYGLVLVTVMNLTTLTTVIMDLCVDPAQSIRMKTSTRRVVWILDASVLMTVAFLGAVRAPKQMKSMICCLNLLQKVNNELNICPWPKRREIKKFVLYIFWSLSTIALILNDHMLLSDVIMKQHVSISRALQIMYFFYYMGYWIMQQIIFQFALISLHIFQSFKAINDKLKNLSQVMSDAKKIPLKSPMNKGHITLNKKRKKSANTIIDSLAFVGKVKAFEDHITQPAHETVHDLALTFVSVCDAVREVDMSFGVMLLLLLGSFLLHLIVSPYYLINSFAAKNFAQDTINLVLQIIWCVFHIIDLVMMIEPCHLTLKEIEETQEQISHLMQHTRLCNEPLAIELDLFYRHLVLNRVSYSPLKVTKLNRGLVVTILGSVATYLAIVTQL